MYNKLVIKVNDTGINLSSTTELVTKVQYDFDKQVLEKKIKEVDKKVANTSELLKKLDYKKQITQNESKIASGTTLMTIAAFNK